MSVKKVNWLITDHNITVNYEGQTHIVPRADALADKLIKAIKEEKLDEIPSLVSVSKRVKNFSNGDFVVKDGQIFVNGVLAPPVLGTKIVKFANEGLPFKPLVKFADNLQKNPSFRAVNELFSFLEKNDHPLTSDGNFIAYKRVRGNFKDIHSNTFDNSVGVTVEMARNQVNEDSTQTCSNGLHVANWYYANSQFASSDPSTDVMLEVEVNPADVVSVPVDYNNAKIRVCKYKVLAIVDKEHSSDLSFRNTATTIVPGAICGDDTEETSGECLDCGEEIEDGEYYCINCPEEEEEIKTCLYCEEVVEDSEELCENHESDDDPYDYNDEFQR